MSTRFRKDRGKFEVSVYVDGKRTKHHFGKEKDARDFEREAKLRKIGLSGIPKAPTIQEAVQDFLATSSAFKTGAGRKEDARFLGLALHFMEKERGHRKLDEVRVEDVELFMLWLAQPRQVEGISKQAWTYTTIARCVKLFKGLLRKNFVNERIARNVGQFLNVPRGTSKQRRAMTQAEFELLLSLADDVERPILLFLRLTGARASSVAGLVWGDVDFEAGVITLRSKKGKLHHTKEIHIPMYPELLALMSKLWNDRTLDPLAEVLKNCVFTNHQAHPMTAAGITARGSRLIKQAKLKGVVLYGLRHAIGVDMTRAGVSLELIRQALGHSSVVQTQTYVQSIESSALKNSFELIRGGKTEESPSDETVREDKLKSSK